MKEKGLEIFTPQGFEEEDKPKKMRFKKKSSCDRCGSCCAQSSPSLMKEDIALFLSGILSDENTYTIREGEIVRSVDGSQYESFLELIKIREGDSSSACIFYDNGCTIYERRPLQCRLYNCWEIQEIEEGLEQKGLKRIDIFGSVELIMQAIQRHEEKCSYKKLSDSFERLNNGDDSAVDDIIDMLQYDTYLREFLTEKLNLKPRSTDLILGRSLTETINEFGIKVIKKAEEYILQPLKEGRR